MIRKILAVEDHHDIAKSLELVVKDLGFVFEHAGDGEKGLAMALENEYACILLDIILPGLEGTEVCRRIRRKNESVPIIMLTSKADDLHKVLGLELGADDYVTKPFSQPELQARIRAVLRRSERPINTPEILNFDDVSIDIGRRTVAKRGQPVELTSLQFEILVVLAKRAGFPVSRQQMSDELFGHDIEGFDHSLSVHINRIRSRLENNPAHPQLITTVRGIGYTFGPSNK